MYGTITTIRQARQMVTSLHTKKIRGRITNAAEAVFNYSLCKHVDITSGADFKYSSTRQYSTFDTIPKPSNSIASVYTSLFYKSRVFHMELGGRYNHDSKYGNNETYTVNPSVLLFQRLKIFATAASRHTSHPLLIPAIFTI